MFMKRHRKIAPISANQILHSPVPAAQMPWPLKRADKAEPNLAWHLAPNITLPLSMIILIDSLCKWLLSLKVAGVSMV